MDKGKRCSGYSLKIIEKQILMNFLQYIGDEKKNCSILRRFE